VAEFLYDGLSYDLMAQYVDPGSPRTTYYYRDPRQILSRHEIQGDGSGLQYFHHYDGLGDTSAWTNQSGMETQEYMYAPYGRLIDNNGPDNSSNQTDPHTNLTWSGKPWDPETELNYFGARDYDSTTGTWIEQDPYRGQLMEPMTLHRYGYVKDNPISLIDRYGFSNESIQNLLLDLEPAKEAAPSAQLRSSINNANNSRDNIISNNTQSNASDDSWNGGTKAVGYHLSEADKKKLLEILRPPRRVIFVSRGIGNNCGFSESCLDEEKVKKMLSQSRGVPESDVIILGTFGHDPVIGKQFDRLPAGAHIRGAIDVMAGAPVATFQGASGVAKANLRRGDIVDFVGHSGGGKDSYNLAIAMKQLEPVTGVKVKNLTLYGSGFHNTNMASLLGIKVEKYQRKGDPAGDCYFILPAGVCGPGTKTSNYAWPWDVFGMGKPHDFYEYLNDYEKPGSR
jgi:RHS repeat-associated protein